MGPFDVILTIIILLIVAIVWLIKRVRKKERDRISTWTSPQRHSPELNEGDFLFSIH